SVTYRPTRVKASRRCEGRRRARPDRVRSHEMTPRRSIRPPKRRPGRPPGATSDATRARIVRAARVCFARTGYANTTNKDIADHAGITAAAIYQYFDSKTALYVETARDAQAELVPE